MEQGALRGTRLIDGKDSFAGHLFTKLFVGQLCVPAASLRPHRVIAYFDVFRSCGEARSYKKRQQKSNDLLRKRRLTGKHNRHFTAPARLAFQLESAVEAFGPRLHVDETNARLSALHRKAFPVIGHR